MKRITPTWAGPISMVAACRPALAGLDEPWPGADGSFPGRTPDHSELRGG